LIIRTKSGSDRPDPQPLLSTLVIGARMIATDVENSDYFELTNRPVATAPGSDKVLEFGVNFFLE